MYENVKRDEIQRLFPDEVSPELRRLLMLLLQKFQREWREDAIKDQVMHILIALHCFYVS